MTEELVQVSDVKLAFEGLNNKAELYDALFDYYDGDQPLKYSTERLREIFQHIDATFQENWCAVVVDALMDRLSFTGWDAEDSRLNDGLDEYFDIESVAIEAEDAHQAAAICGEGFIMAWPDEAGRPQVFQNDPRLVHAFYEAQNPKRLRMAAKWWVGEDDLRYLTLYYPDRLEYYVSKAKSENVRDWRNFEPMDPPSEVNPFGVIPVWHLRRNRRSGMGELTTAVVSQQDAVNKLFSDMMVAAEFGSFKQRYIISGGGVSTLKNAPNEIWDIPAGDGVGQPTQVGEFSTVDLKQYLDSMDRIANSMAVVTGTPKHLFFSGSVSNVSGEALIALEAPLNKKVEAYQRRFSPVWRELGVFLVQLLGFGEVSAGDLTVLWEQSGTVQPKTEAETLRTNIDAGLPLITLLKRNGWTQSEIDAMMDDLQEEKERNASMGPLLLEMARAEAASANPMEDPVAPDNAE